MNPKDIEILNKAKEKYPTFFKYAKVLELGSRNINGSVRECFEECEFMGVDWIEGKDVDYVTKFIEVSFPENYFDTLISYSAFEHDPWFEGSLDNNLRFLRPGGMIFFNWGGPGSPKHGEYYSADIKGEPTGAFIGTKDLKGIEPKGGYFPISMGAMTDFLVNNGVKVLECGKLPNYSLYLHARKADL